MRSRRLIRCQGCGLSDSLCVCSSLPVLSTTTRIVILAHRIELTKSTNTGRLVARMLGERGALALHDAHWEPSALSTGAYVLFPAEDAQPLEEVVERIQTLIVPDGTWAQTRRIARKHPGCKDLKKVRLTDTPRSAYSLRRSRLRGGLCTLEAVAHALRVLEGDACADTMLTAFAGWVERALMVRAGAHAVSLPAD
jgi:DTW domain-containing protein YfiP